MQDKNPVKRFAPKLHVKKGDKVMVIAGSEKGKSGVVSQVIIEKNRAIVEDVNLVTKHSKPSNNNPGGISKIAAPIHLSNLMLIDPKSGTPSRIGRKIDAGKSVRYSKKSGEIIK
jgi:large subunit ribosomal protein L24